MQSEYELIKIKHLWNRNITDKIWYNDNLAKKIKNSECELVLSGANVV